MEEQPLIKTFLGFQSDFMAYLMAITRNVQASEEIFQNAAIVVMEAQVAGEEIRNIRAWSKEVIRRQALAFLQSEHRKQERVRAIRPELLEQIDGVFDEQPLSSDQSADEQHALQTCIAAMDDQSRHMLAMRYEQRASFADIGADLEKTAGAVQRALSRIRKQLKHCVQTKLAGPAGVSL